MKLTVKDNQGKDSGELNLNFTPVEAEKGGQAVHDVVVAYMAAQRSRAARLSLCTCTDASAVF